MRLVASTMKTIISVTKMIQYPVVINGRAITKQMREIPPIAPIVLLEILPLASQEALNCTLAWAVTVGVLVSSMTPNSPLGLSNNVSNSNANTKTIAKSGMIRIPNA